jgi:hypothetical protein
MHIPQHFFFRTLPELQHLRSTDASNRQTRSSGYPRTRFLHTHTHTHTHTKGAVVLATAHVVLDAKPSKYIPKRMVGFGLAT